MFYEGTGVAYGRYKFFAGVAGHLSCKAACNPSGGAELVVIHSFMVPQTVGNTISMESVVVRTELRLYNQGNRTANIAERLATKLHLSY